MAVGLRDQGERTLQSYRQNRTGSRVGQGWEARNRGRGSQGRPGCRMIRRRAAVVAGAEEVPFTQGALAQREQRARLYLWRPRSMLTEADTLGRYGFLSIVLRACGCVVARSSSEGFNGVTGCAARSAWRRESWGGVLQKQSGEYLQIQRHWLCREAPAGPLRLRLFFGPMLAPRQHLGAARGS